MIRSFVVRRGFSQNRTLSKLEPANERIIGIVGGQSPSPYVCVACCISCTKHSIQSNHRFAPSIQYCIPFLLHSIYYSIINIYLFIDFNIIILLFDEILHFEWRICGYDTIHSYPSIDWILIKAAIYIYISSIFLMLLSCFGLFVCSSCLLHPHDSFN